jgi:signal transduction histidine kinase
MPAQPAALWAFFLATIFVGAILVVAVGAAVIVSQRKMARVTRAFASQQVAASEEERSRVARELHDDVIQQIAVLSHRPEALHEQLLATDVEPPLLDSAEAVGDGLRGLASTVRGVAHQMHPSMLDHLGLGPALQSLAREVASGTAMRIEVAIEGKTEDVPTPAALCLYRVAQEALRNVFKHSHASRATILVWRNGPDVVLEVADDGIGFAAEPPTNGPGLGLVSMRERVRLSGGELTVLSEPGRGTLVTARVSTNEEV